MVTSDGGDTGGWPWGGVPVAVAELVTVPASTSACVIVYVASQVTAAAGARVAAPAGHTTSERSPVPVNAPSSTCTSVSGTLPVFVTRNEYVISSPTAYSAATGDADFTTVIAGACGTNSTVASAGGLRPTLVMLSGPFVNVPATGEVTSTVIAQDVMPWLRLPVTATEVPPSGAVTTPEGQVVEASPSAIVRPAGSASVKDQPFFAASSSVFVTVSVSVEVSPATTLAGLKDLSSCGETSSTWMLSNAWSLPAVPPPVRFRATMPTVAPGSRTAPGDT